MFPPNTKDQKVYLYPKPVNFRKSIHGLATLTALDITLVDADAPQSPPAQRGRGTGRTA